MTTPALYEKARMLRGGLIGPLMILLGIVLVGVFFYFYLAYPHFSRSYGKEIPFNGPMFGPAIEQPIPFSHRLHVTDKQIDCFYCHPYGERSTNTGVPSVEKCLGCHNHIIPEHEWILKLKQYEKDGEALPWVRVYYKPDHTWFPHYRHLTNKIDCVSCHGEVEKVDRLHQVTFYMGYCIDCHKEKNAPLDCWACHK